MANYTQHYQLHQWVPEDDFLRTDFNEDFKKIDTAIKSVETDLQANLDNEVSRLDGAITTAQQTVQKNLNTQVARLDGQVDRLDGLIDNLEADKAEIVTGTYTGDGAATRQISLGFAPRAVILVNFLGVDSIIPGYGAQPGGIAIRGGTCHEGLTLTSTGFQLVQNQYSATNTQGQLYSYLSVK